MMAGATVCNLSGMIYMYSHALGHKGLLNIYMVVSACSSLEYPVLYLEMNDY